MASKAVRHATQRQQQLGYATLSLCMPLFCAPSLPLSLRSLLCIVFVCSSGERNAGKGRPPMAMHSSAVPPPLLRRYHIAQNLSGYTTSTGITHHTCRVIDLRQTECWHFDPLPGHAITWPSQAIRCRARVSGRVSHSTPSIGKCLHRCCGHLLTSRVSCGYSYGYQKLDPRGIKSFSPFDTHVIFAHNCFL